MLLPRRCAVCDRSGAALCPACAASIRAAPAGAVPAAFVYDGAGRRVVLALKYRNARGLLAPVASAMSQLVDRRRFDIVTWAPTGPGRRRSRGYDQAELLARAVARHLRLPCRGLLRRAHGSGPQAGLGRQGRLGGPVFTAVRLVRGRVLVVDDVVTTGATLRAATDTLLRAGASHVQAIAAAATPSATGSHGPDATPAPSYTRDETRDAQRELAWTSRSAVVTSRSRPP